MFRTRAFVSLLALFSANANAGKSPEDFVAAPAKTGTPATAVGAPGAPGKPAATAAPAARTAPAATAAPTDTAKKSSATPKTAPGKPARATAGQGAAKPVIDTARIHGQYLEGDFDQAIRSLDGALKGRKALNHADSVFIFKHLGVMYAASPATREKGRFYMLQLISIEPTARILDMYASDMIYLIFRNVQEEYENKHAQTAFVAPADSAADAPPAAEPEPAPAPAASAQPPKRNRTLYWAAGGAAVAAGVAGLIFILLDDPQPKQRTILLKE